MKMQNALVSNILKRSQRYFAHVTTVTLSWRVQNIVVIGRVYFTLECFEFSSNFEFDRNMLSGTGARPWAICSSGKLLMNLIHNMNLQMTLLKLLLHLLGANALTIYTCYPSALWAGRVLYLPYRSRWTAARLSRMLISETTGQVFSVWILTQIERFWTVTPV